MVQEIWEREYRYLQVVRNPVADEPVAKRQRKYYNPFQEYCERSPGAMDMVKEEASDP